MEETSCEKEMNCEVEGMSCEIEEMSCEINVELTGMV